MISHLRLAAGPVLAATLLLAIAPGGLHAQATPEPAADPAADLQSMRAKAATDPELARVLDQLTSMATRRVSTPETVSRMVFARYPVLRNGIERPVSVRAVVALHDSARRTQLIARILLADLDGDWRITRQELSDTMTVQSASPAAEAFFSSDADGDGVLSSEEIRSAVELQLSYNQGRPGTADMIVLFDLDDDGYVSADELERGIAALGG